MWKSIVGLSLIVGALFAGEVKVTAAADTVYAFKEIQAAYQKENPEDKVTIAFGSTGKAYTQITNGAPYDMYFAADMGYVQKLKAQGLAVSEPRVYAYGRIGIWAPKKSGLDVTRGFALFLDDKVKRIAIADPSHAPYGVAAVEAMQSQKFYEGVKAKFALGENVSQAAQFIQSGAADVGVLPISLAYAEVLKKEGNFYLLPKEWHNDIVQGYVILKSGENNPTAKKFEAFVGTPKAREIFKKYGFVLPSEL